MNYNCNCILINIIIILIIYIIYLRINITNNLINNNDIKGLVRQIARWSSAALQDENPLVATLHANYGAAYLWALTDIKTDLEIENATGINIKKLRKEVIKTQDISTLKMLNKCPINVKNEYLARLAGEFN